MHSITPMELLPIYRDTHELTVEHFLHFQAVLHIALQGGDMRERVSALKVLLAFCTANSEGQQALVSGMHLPKPQGPRSAGLLI